MPENAVPNWPQVQSDHSPAQYRHDWGTFHSHFPSGASRPVLIASISPTGSFPTGLTRVYAVNNSLADVYRMPGFGVFGYFMRLYGYPLGSVILGVILSRLLDNKWRRAVISERGDPGRLF